jgi:hypothetical protein
MGPEPLIFDHNLALELWNDPLFWEAVPTFEQYREEAESEAAKAAEQQSSLSVKSGYLYNHWIKLLRKWHLEEPNKVRQLADYIHKKRQNRHEAIVLPGDSKHREPLILSEGVE